VDAMKKQQELDNYYTTLRNTFTENNLMDKPGQIYNVDESGMPIDNPEKDKGNTSGNKSLIITVACINAIGQTIPSFINFDAKNLNMEWTREEVPGTTYGLSDSG